MINIDIIDVHTNKSLGMKLFPTVPQIGDYLNFKKRETFVVKRVEWVELDKEFFPKIFVS